MVYKNPIKLNKNSAVISPTTKISVEFKNKESVQ